jgi:hypothetical protein
MKNKYFLVVLFLILSLFFLFNILNVNATMYKVLDEDGNVIRLTNKPYLSVSEKEAGYTLDPPIIESDEENISEAQTATTYQYDFRKANWGMSKEEVKATEDKKPDSEYDNSLVYYVKIGGDDYLCGYSFLQDKLYNTGYVFVGEHSNKNDYIRDYKNLKEILAKKYGKPWSDRTTWDNDLFKNDRSQWGLAVSIGHLSYGTIWDTSNTHVTLGLSGDNYEISLLVAYDSRELEKWVDEIKEEKAKSKF